MVHPETTDKGCSAKTEIARPDDVGTFVAGSVSMRDSPCTNGAILGTSIDTAAGLRASAAFGLVLTNYHDTGLDLVQLLADNERGARAGEVHVLAHWGGSEAPLLLRH